MPKEPTLTVVIPAYNREMIVIKTLDSVAAQTCRDFRLVIVDNNSTDGTLEAITQWAGRNAKDIEKKIVEETRPGAASARNRGLAEVTTQWVMFFDSDDTMSPTHIACAIEAIKRNPKAQVIGWDLNYHYPNVTKRMGFTIKDAQYNSLFHGTTSTLRYCVRTDLFRSIGGWNSDVRTWDDIEVGARLLASAPVMIKLKGEPTVDVFVQDDSITNHEMPEHIEMLDRALNSISATLGPDKAHWIELKRMIIAAVGRRCDSRAALPLRDTILRRTPKLRHRIMLKFAYWYTAHGGRGIARILRPLM